MAISNSELDIKSRIRKNELIGAVIEFNCGSYFAYGLVTHQTDFMGPLLQLNSGRFLERPGNLEEVMLDNTFGKTFFQVKKAIKYPEVNLVQFVELTTEQKKFPRMRSGGGRYRDKITGEWRTGSWAIVEPNGDFVYVPWDSKAEEIKGLADKSLASFAGIKYRFDHNLTSERKYQIAMGDLKIAD